jgi:acyl CoA:acetate/3-ketoacid CoA transferase beta subunit
MEHVTPKGEPKILRECSYPLTAQRCVDLIVTDLALIEVTANGLLLREVAPGVSADAIERLTEATLRRAPDLREMAL